MAGFVRHTAAGGGSKYNSSNTAKAGDSTKPLFTTGLFAPKNKESKSIGTVQVKETLTIPAGSFINLYQVEEAMKKGDTSPDFRITVREGMAKSAS